MKKFILLITICLIILFLGKDLNPFSNYFFTFHDETQPARIEQFTKELKKLNIPPRVASDMNFGIGYPLFNFYAPFPYLITSTFHILGFSIINSLKISFLIAIIIAFYSMYKFLNIFFNFYSSIIGGILYITSLYFPLNIFVRGNLGEIWFLSLFPLGVSFLIKTTKNIKIDKKIFLTKIIIFSFILTSHNLYSLFFIFFSIFLIIFIKKNWQINFLSVIIALFLSSYFYLPFFLEMKYVWAKEVATLTNYKDHFLCLYQLWDSPWGFGGSSQGCQNDGMSFKIGKIQLILFILGIILFLTNLFQNKKDKIINYLLLFTIYSLFSLFLTTYSSQPLWQLFEPVLKLFQFPWRFIGLSLMGIVFIESYFLNRWEVFKKFLFSFLLIIVILFINSKYFTGQKIENNLFKKKYLSQEYIKNKVAYKVAEYLPKTNDYQYWRRLENKKVTQKELQKLSLKPFSKDKQTLIQQISNLLTLITLFVLIFLPKKFYNWLNKYGKRN